MNIGAILAGIALLLLVAAYVARPLFEKQSGNNNGCTASPNAQLTERRDSVYALIRELDADHQTQKVNDQDYRAQRERYVAEGVSLLKQLDELSSKDSRAAMEAEIEARVLSLRQAPPPTDTTRPESAARFCTQCGHPAVPEDNFCGSCGATLKGTA